MAASPRFGFYYALASIPLMGAGVFGPDVFHLSVEGKTIAFYGCLGLAVLCVVIGPTKELRAEAGASVTPGHRRRMIAIAGMFASGMAFLIFAAIYFWPQRSVNPAGAPAAAVATPSSPQKPWKHELEDLYNSDFNLLSMQRELEANAFDADDPAPVIMKMRFRIYQDFIGRTDFVSIFISISHNIRHCLIHPVPPCCRFWPRCSGLFSPLFVACPTPRLCRSSL
jgi:hypothetical protein